MHYVMPFLQTLLGTNRAFDAHGVYRDATSGEPASGGQLAAFWGTEIGSRRDRALIAYDADVDFEAFVTPCCDFDKIWSAATLFLESRDLMCKVTRKGSPRRHLPNIIAEVQGSPRRHLPIQAASCTTCRFRQPPAAP